MKTIRSAALAAACLALAPASVRAERLTPPDVPAELVVSDDHRPYLVGHATGTQNYVCAPSTQTESGVAWTLYGPQATLFGNGGGQIMTHFLSPNPDEAGTPRPAWQHSRDTSTVWGFPIATYKEADYVAPGAIPWLKLEVRGRSLGPNRGRKLVDTSFIQRVHTSGGAAPATGCDTVENLGAKQLVPYETDYYFYRPRGRAK
jgi:hypothetical protein